MSVKTTSRAARLKNYLRMLMQQQSWILSKKSTFISLFSGYCYFSILCQLLELYFYLAYYITRFNIYMLLHIRLLLYLFHNIQLQRYWCAIKKLLTHSLTHSLDRYI